MIPGKKYDKYGLIPLDHHEMNRVFQSIKGVKKVTLFGSRAKGNWKPGSDIDLAVTYDHRKKFLLSKLKDTLEETTKIPYFFDVIDETSITSEELKKHIQRVGVNIWNN